MPSRRNTVALVGVVDRRQLDVLALDVAPDVQLGPVGDREHPHVLARARAGRCRGSTAPGAALRGSQRPNASRRQKIRSLARARSSSRRPPPNTASNRCSVIASSSGTVCSGLRVPSGALDEPAVVDPVLHVRDLAAAGPARSTSRSRKSMTSGKLCPVSTCSSGNGTGAGANALTARCSSSVESLPPENRITGRSNSPATSRKMWIDSALQARRARPRVVARRSLSCSPHSVLASAGPAAGARVGAGQRLRRARRAADRRVALVDQRVHEHAVLARCRPPSRSSLHAASGLSFTRPCFSS